MISSALRERLRTLALRVLFVVGIAAIILALALLLTACQTTAGRGLTAVWAQRVHTLNTRQPCSSDPTTLRTADLALVLYVAEAARAGVVASYEAGAALLRGRPIAVCMVSQWEPCCVGSICAQGSRGPDSSPKAGCSGDLWAWAVDSGTLIHELGHVVATLLGVPQRPDHHDAWAKVEARVQAAFAAAVAP